MIQKGMKKCKDCLGKFINDGLLKNFYVLVEGFIVVIIYYIFFFHQVDKSSHRLHLAID